MKTFVLFFILCGMQCGTVHAQFDINRSGYDSESYIQGFIDAKYDNDYQVTPLKDSVINMKYEKLQKFFTACMPPGPQFLLLFRYGSGSPTYINSASAFQKDGPDRITINDSTIRLTSRERAVLYLILKEVPVNGIFVTKAEYSGSLFFQKLAIPVTDAPWIRRRKPKRKEEIIIADFNQAGYTEYTVRFRERYKYTMTGESKKYIARKLKKNQAIINVL